jgi:hypothetical protein
MSIFTGSELEFLAGLNKSWWRLYWKEFSRLRRTEAVAPKGPSDGNVGFPAEFGGCGEHSICAFRQRSAANAATSDALQRRVELVAGNR